MFNTKAGQPGIYLLVLVIMVAMQLLGCESRLSGEEYIQRAKDFQEKSDYASSVIQLKNALRGEPDNIEARWLLGEVYLELGLWASAEKELRRAEELGVSREAVIVSIIESLLRQGKFNETLNTAENIQGMGKAETATIIAYMGHAKSGLGLGDEAQEAYDSSLSLNENEYEALFGKAYLEFGKRNYEKARVMLSGLTDKYSNESTAWSLLGDLERVEGNPKQAERAYTNAVKNQKNNVKDLLKRAQVRIYLDDIKGANQDINLASTYVADNSGVIYLKGLVKFKQKEYSDAMELFQEAISRNRNNMQAVYYLGVTHYVNGNYEQAQSYLTSYIQKNKNSYNARILIGLIDYRLKDYARAKEMLEPLIRSNPDDAIVFQLMGRIELALGDIEKSVEYLKRATELNPDSTLDRVGLGLGLLMSGEEDVGIKELEAAVDIDPELGASEVTLILSQLQVGNFDEALSAARNLKDQYPDRPEVLNLLGVVYMVRGENDEAAEVFESVIELVPGFTTASFNLAGIRKKQGDSAEAKRIYYKVLEDHPDDLTALIKVAELESEDASFTKANDLLERAMKAHPSAWQPRLVVADYNLRIGNPGKALSLLSEVDMENADPRVFLTAGEAQLALNEPRNALQSFRKYEAKEQKSVKVNYLMARAYAQLNDKKMMRVQLNKTLDLDPDNPQARISMIRLLLMENKINDAESALKNLKQLYPETAEVYFEEGELAASQKQTVRAIDAYQKAVTLSAKSEYIVKLALARVANADTEGGLRTLKKRLDEQPDDYLARYYLANLYVMSGDEVAAIAEFEKVLEQMPDNSLVMNNLAFLFITRDTDRALAYAEKALELSPNNPVLMDTMGMVLLQAGSTIKGLRKIQDAARLMPEDMTIKYHLALALDKSGDADGAIAVLEQVLASGKKFPEQDVAKKLLSDLKSR